MNSDIKKVIGRVKDAQTKLQTVLKNQDWVDEARKYADKQRQEVRKLLNTDLAKVKVFIERERKELEKFQKQIPGEVKRFKGLLGRQRKELEKLLSSVRKASRKAGPKGGKKARSKKGTSAGASSG